MVGYYNQGVPSSDLGNNHNQKKYTVNPTPKGKVVISKTALILMAMAALLLLILAVLLTYFLVPSCSDPVPPPSALAAITTRSERIVEDIRLPTSLQPTHYSLKLIPFLDERNFTTNGAVIINFIAKEDTAKIVLNLNDIDVDKHSVKVRHANETNLIDINEQSLDNSTQKYTILVDEGLRQGKEYELEMEYVGHLNDYMQGFYRSHYWDPLTNTTKWIASTQFSPTDARRAFPCFDEPSYKAKYTISIGRPANMTSLSNMPIMSTVTENDITWDHFKETPSMSSYLVAFIVSDLQPFRHNLSTKPFIVWSRPDVIDQTRFVANIGPKILQYFETYFQIKFPLPKIDVVAVPDFGFSAMENWGLITFRETALLSNEKVSTIEDVANTGKILAHELAHQWFGNLVTPRWWDDLWLKEGFANYLQYLAIDNIKPAWNILEEFTYSETSTAFAMDSLKATRPISVEVTTNADIRQMFDSISYAKGASLIRMMNHFLGETVFKEGLINYLNTYQYSNAIHSELWGSFKLKTNGDGTLSNTTTVTDIMESWVKQAGFPVVTAIRNYENMQVHVSQKRFLYSNQSDTSVWWVPISYTSDVYNNFDTRPKLWLKNQREASFELKANEWWLLNMQQTGYFIVNYDEQNWRSLAYRISTFPPVIRAQLVSDSFDLARANLLDYSIPLKMLESIGIEDKNITYVPILTALDKAQYLYDMLISTPAFGELNGFLTRIFSFAFDTVDFNDSPLDDHRVQKIRRLVLSWSSKFPETRANNVAKGLYRDWMINPNETIRPNVRDVVYITGIREGGEREWNRGYHQYLISKSVSEKNTLLNALGSTQVPWLLTKYLGFTLRNDSGIRKQDAARVFLSVSQNVVGHSLAFDFLRTNWNALQEYYGPAFSSISAMVDNLSTYMNTPYQLKQLETFKEENSENLGTAKNAFERSIEKVRGNVEWIQHSYHSVSKWLEDHRRHYRW